MSLLTLTKLTVKARLFISIAAMIIPLSILAAGSLLYFYNAFASFNRLIQDPFQEITLVARVQVNLLNVANELIRIPFSLSGDTPEQVKRITTHVDHIYQEALESEFLIPAERRAIVDSRAEWLKALNIVRETLDHSSREKTWKNSQMERFSAHTARAVALLDHASRAAADEVQELLNSADTARRRFLATVIILICLSLAIAMVSGVRLARSIFIPLKALEEGTSRLGSGDLGHRIASEGTDEFSRLAQTFNNMASRIQSAHRTLSELSVRDSLTGLYNNGEFYRLLEAEIVRSQRYHHVFAVLMLDFDHFKRINDNFGHQAGDIALRQAAAALTSGLRPVDCVSRYGGEEFAIILPETSLAGALLVAERLRRTICEIPVEVAIQKAINISVSIGIAVFPEQGNSSQALIALADSALYEAKRAGRNCVRAAATPTQESAQKPLRSHPRKIRAPNIFISFLAPFS